jgi:hypothetical protein
MNSLPSPETALARWLAQGVTSQTHGLLRRVLYARFRPLGIEADALEAEPFSALESGQGGWWLKRPRWDPRGFDRAHPAAADFKFLLEAPDRFTVAVDPQGRLFVELPPAFRDDPAAVLALRESEQGWRAARHAIRAAEEADAFILAAAALLLANDPAAAIYAAGDDDGFCAALQLRLANARSA